LVPASICAVGRIGDLLQAGNDEHHRDEQAADHAAIVDIGIYSPCGSPGRES
jgi:hypothetical protein